MAEPSFTCITSSPLLLKDFTFANILKYTTILNTAHECLNDYTSVIIKGQALFKEHFVTGICFADVPIGDNGDGSKEKWIIRAKVKAEMKKTVTYCVTVTIHRDGEVQTATCGCPGGERPACCKHVFALLAAVEDYSRKELYSAPTEKLQSWHQPKANKISPKKFKNGVPLPGPSDAQDVDFSVLTTLPSTAPIFSVINQSPSDILFSDQLFYGKTLPLPSHTEPHISNYSPPHINFDSLLFYHSKVRKNLKELRDLEFKTMSQGSSLWHEERKKRITASEVFNVINCKDYKKCSLNMIESSSKDISNIPPIKLGRRLEPMVKNVLRAKFPNHIFRNAGLVVHPQFPFLAASPDGVLFNTDDPMLVEIKVIYNPKRLSLEQLCEERQDFYLIYDSLNKTFSLKTNHKHFFQIQSQLFCSGLPKCLFVVFSDFNVPLFLQVIEADTSFWTDKVTKISDFYFMSYLPELLKRNL